MKIVLQRSKAASVTVNKKVVGSIKSGFVLLVGVTHHDTVKDAEVLANKIAQLRVFEDESGKMNRSLLEVGGEILSVSQFTLFGDCRKGRRPNFMNAAKPAVAEAIYDYFNERLSAQHIPLQTGEFGAMMEVRITNDGPVTLILESENGSLK